MNRAEALAQLRPYLVPVQGDVISPKIPHLPLRDETAGYAS